MNTLSFERREASDGTAYTRATGELRVKEHTVIRIDLNLQGVDGSQPLNALAVQLMDTAIAELQKAREHTAKTVGLPAAHPS